MSLLPTLRRISAAAIAVALLAGAAAAPGDRLADPAQEARARTLFRDVRCLVCQGESIDESDADLAHDLRQLVRGQIAAGRTDAQIRGFLVSRYGQFVLLTPRASLGNVILWAGPLLVIAAGAAALVARGRLPREPAPLSSQEEDALAEHCGDERR